MNTSIKNIGMMNTYISKNNEKYKNEIKWDGNYDGNIAKLNLDIDNNGKKESIHMELDNQDLLKLLNSNAVNMPLDERLKMDYLDSKSISYKKKSRKNIKSSKNKKINKNRKMNYNTKKKSKKL